MKRFDALMTVAMLWAAAACAAAEPTSQHVVAISIDGLRPDALTQLGPDGAPAFHHIMRQGAHTLNARTDHDYTNTIPNHTAMLTGRGVTGPRGHNYTHNSTPKINLQDNKKQYIASAFDVAHDHNLTTALFPSKSKFILYPMSWDADHGAADTTGEDNGRNKIDQFRIETRDELTLRNVLKALQQDAPRFMFVHFRGPDTAGHGKGWMSEPYLADVKKQDAQIKRILEAIQKNPKLKGSTTVLITSDHGGTGKNHQKAAEPKHYTIGFFAWGAGVEPGADLYKINPTRADPGGDRVPYDAPKQPIRNGDIANLSMKLLGLPAVPGSFIGAEQDLKLKP